MTDRYLYKVEVFYRPTRQRYAHYVVAQTAKAAEVYIRGSADYPGDYGDYNVKMQPMGRAAESADSGIQPTAPKPKRTLTVRKSRKDKATGRRLCILCGAVLEGQQRIYCAAHADYNDRKRLRRQQAAARQASRSHKLTESQVIEIKRLLVLGYQKLDIAEQFNVSPATITYIAKGRFWQHVPWPTPQEAERETA